MIGKKCFRVPVLFSSLIVLSILISECILLQGAGNNLQVSMASGVWGRQPLVWLFPLNLPWTYRTDKLTK